MILSVLSFSKNKSRSVSILNLNEYLEHPFISIFYIQRYCIAAGTALKLEFKLAKFAPKLKKEGVYKFIEKACRIEWESGGRGG